MSLINKMLQDLESRKNPPSDSSHKKSVYEDLRPVSKAARSRAPSGRMLALLALAVLAGGGAYAWTQWGDTLMAKFFPAEPAATTAPVVARKPAAPRPAPAPQAAPATPPVVTQAPVEASSGSDPESPVNVTQAAPPAPVPPKPAQSSNTGSPKAASAAASGYWTVSPGETLYGISAKTGIDLWALSSWNRLDKEHVIHAGQKLRLTPPSNTTPAEPPRAAAVKATQPPKEKPAVAAASGSPKSVPVTEPGAGSSGGYAMDRQLKPFSSNEKAESEYRRAVDLLQKGRATDAEKQLKHALQDDDKHTAARELLAGLMLQQGHWREAQQILEHGIGLLPAYYPFSQLLARVHVEHGADSKALAVMENGRKAGAENPEYLSFLAALYQRVGRHDEAVKSYQQAITLAPQEGRSWLGMAISLEAVQEWEPATRAYQRAIESGVLEDKLLQYARQRLGIVKNK